MICRWHHRQEGLDAALGEGRAVLLAERKMARVSPQVRSEKSSSDRVGRKDQPKA